MRDELILLSDAYDKLRMVKNHVNHEYDMNMYNLNEAIRRLEHFMHELKENEDYKKMSEGD